MGLMLFGQLRILPFVWRLQGEPPNNETYFRKRIFFIFPLIILSLLVIYYFNF